MFCCGGNSEEDVRSKNIEKKLKDDAKSDQSKVKLLLLGAGESGKSTIFKQMELLYGVQPSDEVRAGYTQVIHTNTVENLQKVIDQMYEWDMQGECQCMDACNLVGGLDAGSVRLDEQAGQAIKQLWADQAIQNVWTRRNEFQVIDSSQYFFENIDRIAATNYLPSAQDHLYTRVRTSGVVQSLYNIEGVNFEMYDVGGQRNERRKWIHFFSDVTAVIFVAALSEYNQKLFEDNNTNRMQEALHLFEEIAKNLFFTDSAFILFLNKKDLFEQKLPTNPINEVELWKDYEGGDDPKAGMTYFLDQFVARKGDPKRMIYPHFTTATNTDNISHVFNAAKDIILEMNINESGF